VTSSARCPECFLELKPFQLGSVELDFCQECHGLWFDRGELLKTSKGVHFGTKKIPPMFKKKVREIQSRPRPCVRCNVSLEILDYEGVEIDICEICRGIWLDANELPSLIRRFYTKVSTAKEGLLPSELQRAGEILTLDYLVDQMKTDRNSISEFGRDLLSEMGSEVRDEFIEAGIEIGLETLIEVGAEAGLEVGAEVGLEIGAEIGAAILTFLLGMLS
jgi:Zn-finger nucleic acid-binding protein